MEHGTTVEHGNRHWTLKFQIWGKHRSWIRKDPFGFTSLSGQGGELDFRWDPYNWNSNTGIYAKNMVSRLSSALWLYRKDELGVGCHVLRWNSGYSPLGERRTGLL